VVDHVVTPIGAPSKSRLLVATPRLEDPNFRRAVVLMVEHNQEGSIGVVLNRPSPLVVGDVLPSWGERLGDDAHLLVGGPVEPEAMLAVGLAGVDDEGCTPLDDHLVLIDLGRAPDLFDESVEPILVFAGYTGWGPGQLDGELGEGAWWVFDSEPSDLMTDPGELWHDVLARQGSAATLLREHPDDPSVN